jgi:hypothetical protein
MAFYHDGTFHFLYLYDRRHERSKWGVGAHQFAHLSTRDLIHWDQHPLALPITDQTECVMGTGNCIYHAGTYYLYYIHHGRRIAFRDSPYLGDNIFVATSTDGTHFDKRAEPVVKMDFQKANDTNPYVVADQSGRRFYMIVAGEKNYTSTDLIHWQEIVLPPIDIQGCGGYFRWNDWYYYLGGWTPYGSYRMSRSPLENAHWQAPPAASAQGLYDTLAIPQIAQFKDNRYLLVGFLWQNGWGAEAVFRELVQLPNGTLGMKFPPEMIPPGGEPIPMSVAGISDELLGDHDGIRVVAESQRKRVTLKGLPQNARITLHITPSAKTAVYGIQFRGDGKGSPCHELQFRPKERTVSIVGGPGISQVEGLDRPLTLDIILKDDILDACIDSRRTLIGRVGTLQGNAIVLFCEQGEVAFESLKVQPLIP